MAEREPTVGLPGNKNTEFKLYVYVSTVTIPRI